MNTKRVKLPMLSILFFCLFLIGCIVIPLVNPRDPTYMDLRHCSYPPSVPFYFGTDSMGRDLFSMIWYGGRTSLFIGIISMLISTSIAILYGCISGLSGGIIDSFFMRFVELLVSVPSILLVIFTQAMIGFNNTLGIAVVIGITSWMQIAKVVRNEIKEIKIQDYIMAASSMGGRFLHMVIQHYIPNIISVILFMIIANFGQAIVTEATISFLGLGLPMEVISLGSLLSFADKALLSNQWWVIIVPGCFLVGMLISVTQIGVYLEKRNDHRFSQL